MTSFFVLAALATVAYGTDIRTIPQGQVLGLVSKNIVHGVGNFFTYVVFSHARVDLKTGDKLSYEVYLDPNNPDPKGGIDIDIDGSQSLRDYHIPDQNGIDSHGDGILTPAVGHWYKRIIPLDAAAGHRTNAFTLVFEGDDFGQYAQFVDNVQIVHANGSVTQIFPTNQPPVDEVESSDGYSHNPDLALIPRSMVVDGKPDATAVAEVIQRADRLRSISSIQTAVATAARLEKVTPNAKMAALIQAAQADVSDLQDSLDLPDAAFQAKVANTRKSLAGLAPFLQTFTADLIGHAHIDVQWLWESPESLQAAHDTWFQATRFMKEYPGFSFSQSTPGYYEEVQREWPGLFGQIKKYVKDGQWEIVGGRWCEADENLLSPEDSARQYLYAQRYFKNTFGKEAVVGWEPDTFGHTAQTPQMLKLGGLKYFYFCRGGKGDPIFFWEAPDGTKILTYDEVAAGAWYDTALDNSNLNEIPGYVRKSGKKEMMWVYGVGDHGGGPTKEMIEQAEAWKKDPLMPKTQFSTAQNYFQNIEKSGTSTLPTIQSELEGVFRGCYTTNAKEKRLNDRAENSLDTAEAVATVATTLGGFVYPHTVFTSDWEKLLFNQHHDTICGSSFHWAYIQTFHDLDRIIGDAGDVARDAMVSLSVKVRPEDGGPNFMVFNPLGWKHGGWVNMRLTSDEVGGTASAPVSNSVAVGPNGHEHPVIITDPVTLAARFYASDVPAFGYNVYVIKAGKTAPTPVTVTDNGNTVENKFFKVTFDPAKGCISSLIDAASGKELAGADGIANPVEYLEKANPEAWDINPIVGKNPLKVTSATPIQGADYAGYKFTYELTDRPDEKPTVLTQEFRVYSNLDKIDVNANVDWNVVTGTTMPSPLLRLEFNGNLQSPTASYQVPYAVVTRPTDGEEGPVQQWADISDSTGGVTVTVNCKHGFSAEGSDLKMSVIRGCASPDMLPNAGNQPFVYTITPHAPVTNWAATTRAAAEMEQGFLNIQIPPDGKGVMPLTFSLAGVSNPNMVTTTLKMAEDGPGYIVRAFDASGLGATGWLDTFNPVGTAGVVNFVEDPLGAVTTSGSKIELKLRPWQIETLRFNMK